MLDWLVISADRSNAGRGVSGGTLAWFLRTYFGQRRVGWLSPAQLRKQNSVAADTVCVGFPSTLDERDIQRLRFRRLVLFDYMDRHRLFWTPEQEALLRPLTDVYLKPWHESDWGNGMHMGMLPIRRYGRLSWAVWLDYWSGRRWRDRPRPLHDVAFLGRPNPTHLLMDGEVQSVDQRLEWLRAIRREAPDLKFWGGLVDVDSAPRQAVQQSHGDIQDLVFSGRKLNYGVMYYHMRRSRVLLAPGGNAPWSYRHYEALYAGAVVVTVDFRERDMLIPLPRERMVHVPDGTSVLPAVRQAIEWWHEKPTLGRENFEHLEHYLRYAKYSPRRPALIERFLAQLD